MLVPQSILNTLNHLVTSRLEPTHPLGHTFPLATPSAPNSSLQYPPPHPTPPSLLPAQRRLLLRQTLWGASSRLLPASGPVPTARASTQPTHTPAPDVQ